MPDRETSDVDWPAWCKRVGKGVERQDLTRRRNAGKAGMKSSSLRLYPQSTVGKIIDPKPLGHRIDLPGSGTAPAVGSQIWQVRQLAADDPQPRWDNSAAGGRRKVLTRFHLHLV